MTSEHDSADLYERERRHFVAFIRSLEPAEWETIVPATPAWTVHDVLSHLVGITADLNAQRFGDGDSDAWTEAQIVSRRDVSIDELVAEWDREAPQFVEGLRLFGYDFGAHYVGDLLQHVIDVDMAIGRVPDLRDDGLDVALDGYFETFGNALTDAHVAVEVRADDQVHVLGAGTPVASVTGSRLELFRAIGGRRTAEEIAGLDWSGDADRVLGLVSCYPTPAVSLDER